MGDSCIWKIGYARFFYIDFSSLTVSTYAPLLSHQLYPDAIADQDGLNDEEDWDYDMSTEQAVSEYMMSRRTRTIRAQTGNQVWNDDDGV